MRIFASIRGALILAYLTGIVWLRRDPTSAFYLASTPFAMFFIIAMVTRGGLVANAISGGLVMLLLHHGLSLGSDATLYRIEYKLQDIVVASPISSAVYMLGLALSELVFAGPAAIILGILAIALTPGPHNMALLTLTMLLVWLSGSSLGFLFSTYVPHVRSATQIVALLSGALTVLPPVFYPMNVLPDILQSASYLIPTTHASLLSLFSLGQKIPENWSPSIGVFALLLYTVSFACIALLKARWRQV